MQRVVCAGSTVHGLERQGKHRRMAGRRYMPKTGIFTLIKHEKYYNSQLLRNSNYEVLPYNRGMRGADNLRFEKIYRSVILISIRGE